MADSQNFKLIIEDDEGRRSVVPVELGEVRIGRNDDNAIRLNERNVSRKHAKLSKHNGSVFAEDLESYNGVFVNGDKIKGRHEIHEGDLIKIGDFHLELRGDGLARRTEETTQRTTVPTERETTQPEVRMTSEETAPQAAVVTRPAKAHSKDVEAPAHEATAIIRLDTAELAGGKLSTQTLAGERAKLVCVSTQFAGQQFEITKSEMVIGRTDENDIAIDHRSVSRHHAKIVVQNRRFRLVDLKSANGTLVNGEEYAQSELKRGDLVELGHVKFRFVPPGDTYTLNAEELQVVRAELPAEQTVKSSVPGKKLPLPLLIGAGVLTVFALALLLVLLTKGDTLPTQLPQVQVQVQPSGNAEVDALLGRAQVALSQRKWDEAATLAKAVVALDANNASAAQIVSKAQLEAGAQSHYDAANVAIAKSDWAAAWRALRALPEGSVYKEQSKALLPQVRGAYVAELLQKGKQAVADGDLDTAEGLADEMANVDGASPGMAELRALIEAAKVAERAAVAAKSKQRVERVEKAAPKAPPTRTSPAVNDPPPVSAAPVARDPKASYAEGIGALKNGDVTGAINAFTQCVGIDGNFALCYRALGIAHAKNGNMAKAARYYKQYLKVSPNAADADKVRALLEQYETAP